MFQDVLDWVSYLAVIFTLAFVVFFAVGPGSIPWMITAELFSQGPRPAAMSIAVLMNWFCNFLVGTFFLKVKVSLIWRNYFCGIFHSNFNIFFAGLDGQLRVPSF
jgi:SP family facilitated glucose transporter-like MFS transporter 1